MTRNENDPQLKVCNSPADSYIQQQFLTANHSPPNRGTLLVGCVRASGGPDSSEWYIGHSQNSLAKCFPVLQVAGPAVNNSQKEKKSENVSF